jgi:hypothetical protein
MLSSEIYITLARTLSCIAATLSKEVVLNSLLLLRSRVSLSFAYTEVRALNLID